MHILDHQFLPNPYLKPRVLAFAAAQRRDEDRRDGVVAVDADGHGDVVASVAVAEGDLRVELDALLVLDARADAALLALTKRTVPWRYLSV